MGGLAILARQQGHSVTGADQNVYPPMSTQLQEQGIELHEGFDPEVIKQIEPDIVIIGNAMSRGNACVEYILDKGIRYTSGPQWLSEHILNDRWVLAVSGTHGKTSTASILAWILQSNDLAPGFLIGGVPANFGISARNGDTPFFVIEADEYDTAFFDKRSKFVHYHPRTLVINNLEFDHADIFADLAAIQTQFHHLLRTVPESGLIVAPAKIDAIDGVFSKGCWTPIELLNEQGQWTVELEQQDGRVFDVYLNGEKQGHVDWPLLGIHNVQNALAAIVAARHVGITPVLACECLSEFKGVKRRLEIKGCVNGITVYDDFAHHPTAIETTIDGLRKHIGEGRLTVIFEPRSNTMRMGVHENTLANAFAKADHVYIYQVNDLEWSLQDLANNIDRPAFVYDDTQTIIEQVVSISRKGDHIVIMSNGGFEGIHDRLIAALDAKVLPTKPH